MDIKKTIFHFLLLALLFYFTINSLSIAAINDRFITWTWIAGSVALVNLFLKDILKFFTVNKTFVTIFAGTAIITAILAFFLDTLIPGFDVKGGNFGPFDLGIISLKGFPVDPTAAKILLGIIYALYVAIMDSLGGVTKKAK